MDINYCPPSEVISDRLMHVNYISRQLSDSFVDNVNSYFTKNIEERDFFVDSILGTICLLILNFTDNFDADIDNVLDFINITIKSVTLAN